MAARVIPFPGSEVETPQAPPTVTPCPTCAYPIRSDDSFDIVWCSSCGAAAHGPCFWRLLPLEEWAAFIRWAHTETEEQHPDFICAACRQLEGLGPSQEVPE